MPNSDGLTDRMDRAAGPMAVGAPVLDRLLHRHRRRQIGRALAAVLVVVGLGAGTAWAIADPDETSLQVVDEPGTSVPTTTEPSPVRAVVSSDDGVHLLSTDGSVEQVWDQPAAIAFAGRDLVVGQGGEWSDTLPTRPVGPIMVFEPGGPRALPLEDDERLVLRDAATVVGRRVVLATSATNEQSPETSDQRLLVIDVESGERKDLGSVGGWESGVHQARFMTSALVALTRYESVALSLELRSADGEVRWTVPWSEDATPPALVHHFGAFLVVEAGFVGSALDPQLTVNTIDPATGGVAETEVVTPTGQEIGAGFCAVADSLGGDLLCDQSSGGPLLIELGSGRTSPLHDFAEGVATFPRFSVASSVRGSSPDIPCDSPDAVTGDVDGDGREDQVVHTYVASEAVLAVCTAAGATADLPGMGQAEGGVRLIDIDGDGRHEILYGATSVSSAGYQMAVFRGGELRVVRLGDGSELLLEDGHAVDGTGYTRGYASGCDADGHLVQVTVELDRDPATWTLRRYDIQEDMAVPAGTEQGSTPLTDEPWTIAAGLVTPCRSVAVGE